MEIEAALKELPLHDVRTISQWLQNYLEQQTGAKAPSPSQAPLRLPDYAARRRMIFGDKELPNMVMLAREEERW